jgi:hypothetical protein
LLAPVLFLAACGGGAKPVDEIAFTKNPAGFDEIWLMQPDGSHRQRLTDAAPPAHHAGGASMPARSPPHARRRVEHPAGLAT